MRDEINITVGVPAGMRDELKTLAEAETKATGVKTHLSDVVRRAIMLDLAARKKKAAKKAGAE